MKTVLQNGLRIIFFVKFVCAISNLNMLIINRYLNDMDTFLMMLSTHFGVRFVKRKTYGTYKCFRFDKLGPGYSYPEIQERIRSFRGYERLFPPPSKKCDSIVGIIYQDPYAQHICIMDAS